MNKALTSENLQIAVQAFNCCSILKLTHNDLSKLKLSYPALQESIEMHLKKVQESTQLQLWADWIKPQLSHWEISNQPKIKFRNAVFQVIKSRRDKKVNNAPLFG